MAKQNQIWELPARCIRSGSSIAQHCHMCAIGIIMVLKGTTQSFKEKIG